MRSYPEAPQFEVRAEELERVVAEPHPEPHPL
jgi:hypothetical protein